jgi:uncharacterized membrane protein (UPF0127 family)
LVWQVGDGSIPDADFLSDDSKAHAESMDTVALSRDLRVLKVWHRLPPFRITSISLKTHNVLEIGAGEIDRCKIEVGDKLGIS